ncbi:MAG: PKD domain-containing protein [Flavobacteriales bacterium]
MLNLAHMIRTALLAWMSLFLVGLLPLQSFAQFQGQEFVPNKGQWPQDVLYLAKEGPNKIWMGQDRLLFQITDYSALEAAHHRHETIANPQIPSALFVQKFENCNTKAQLQGLNLKAHHYQFFIGQDETKYASDVRAFEKVAFQNLYTGIDLLFSVEKGAYKYSFIIEPSSDPHSIRWHYEGAKSVKVKSNTLQIQTELGELSEQGLMAYQLIGDQKRTIRCQYKQFPDGSIGFELGNYDPSLPLIIDPVLVFATYNGAISDNFGMTATYGYDGSAFAAGVVYGNNFPLPSLSSFDTSSNFTSLSGGYGITDVFVTRYSPDGSSMLWSSFLGGGDNNQGTETAHSLVCDSLNNIYLFGATSSTDFPISPGAFQSTHGGGLANTNFLYNGVYFGTQGSDIYVSKLSANGQNLLASTYVGGNQNDGVSYRSVGLPYNSVAAYDSLTTNYGDQFRGEIYLDKQGNILIASCSRSANFPTQNAFQATKANGQDAVIFRLNNAMTALQFSSFYGGNKDDAAYSVKTDTLGAIVFAGGTSSNNLAGTTGAYQSTYNGGKTDGFVAKLNALGNSILKASYVGTSNYDQAFFVEIDRNNQVFLLGQSVGGAFPVTNASYSNPGSSQFVIKLNNQLTSNLASTVIGNGSAQINISPAAFLVDICGNIYISGWGANILQSTPLSGMPVSPNAFQSSTTGFDFYLMVLQNNMSGLLYGSYLGGPIAHEHVDGGTSRFDKNGVVYQSVCGGCGGHSDFPTSAGVWSNTNNSANCNNLVFKFDFELIPSAEFSSSVVQGCEDLSITLQNTSTQWDSYLWDFGNGDTTSVIFNPTVTFTNPGTYQINLFVTDSVCLITDTAQVQILVLDSITLNLNDTISLCSSNPYLLVAQTNGTASQFIWSASASLNPALNNPQDSTVIVAQDGWYYCQASNGFCSVLDSVYLAFDTPLQANFSVSDTIGCAPFFIQLQNNSTTTTSFLWDFGNGVQDSNTYEPQLTYNQPGTYLISLQISDSICQGTASSSIQIVVGPSITVQAPSDLFLCSSTDTTLIASTSGNLNAIIWSSNPQFSDTLNPQGSNQLYLDDPQNGSYYVQVVSDFCVATDSVSIQIQAQAINLSGPNSSCAGAPLALQLDLGFTPQQIIWAPASIVSSGQGQQSATVTLNQSQNVYVSILTAQNCLLQDSIFINVSAFNPQSVVATANPLVILPNTSTQLLGQPTGNYNYSWTPTSNLSASNVQNPTAILAETSIFTLQVSDGLCSGSDTVLVKVYDSICQEPYVYVPNAFSPNKDGKNDLLFVRGQYIYEFVFRVYDRWGELVWETNKLDQGWDGTYKGKLLDPDVFDYYLQVTCVGGLENIIKGNITLIR